MLERYVRFLQENEATGDVMVEARGGVEDETLKRSYELLVENGTDNIPTSMWKQYMTSGRLKVKPKSANICGLQIADLLAHPARRDYLLQKQLLTDARNVFGDEVSAILRNSKYRRSRKGKIEGYGQKFLP